MMTNFSGVARQIEKFANDANKTLRLASYNTLGRLAKESRRQIIANYPKLFPDENGIRKNKGVPKQVVYDNKVDKSIPNNPSLRIYANDKISFMEKQEFGGSKSGGTMGKTSAVPFSESLRTMRRGTQGMKDKYTIRQVMASVKQAIRPTLKSGKRTGNAKPKPFFMETKSGHSMVAIRQGKKRFPVLPLYHFDVKRTWRKRWDFLKTIDGVVVSMTDKFYSEELQKILARKFDK